MFSFRTLAFSLFLLAPSIGFTQSYRMNLGDPLPENLFVELAKKVNPTIVNISTSSMPTAPRQGQLRDPFWEFFEQFMGVPGMPRQNRRRGQSIGTGFIIEPEGLIVTNSHVVKSAQVIEVQLSGEDKYHQAEVVGNDDRFDIALIKINVGKPLPYVDIGDSDKVEVGEWVAAFGNPYGHSFSMSKGIISAKKRDISELSPIPFLQTDASINPGNSGGPLVNTKGEVIGVNTAIDARAQGIGFAIPINEVKKIRPQLEKLGHVIRGYIGVSINDISLRAKNALGLPDLEGALLLDVEPGGPAAKGGLRPYDVIRKFGRKKIVASNDLVNAVKDSEIGKVVRVKIVRDGKPKTLRVTVGTPPGTQSLSKNKPKAPALGKADPLKLGFKLAAHSGRVRKSLGIDPSAPKGPIVTHVSPNSAAWRSGMRPGDVILDVNRSKVKLPKDVFRKLRSGENIIRVFNNGHTSLVFLDVND